MPVRYFLLFIVYLIGPPLLIACALIVGTILYPFIPIIYFWDFRKILNGFYQKYKCQTVTLLTLALPFFYATFLIAAAICGALAIAAAAIIIPAFYVFGLIIFVRMFIVQCCRAKKVKNSKKALIDEIIVKRKKEFEERLHL